MIISNFPDYAALPNSLEQFHKAIQFLEQQLEISREIGYRKGEAISLGNLDRVYYSLRQYNKVIKFYKQSLEISQEIGVHQWEANFLGNLGMVYYQVSIELRMRYKSLPKILAFIV